MNGFKLSDLNSVASNVKTFKRIDSIPMGDTCIGIAYVNNQLVVNCIARGLIIMDIYGNVARKLKSITGSIHICTLDDKTYSILCCTHWAMQGASGRSHL
jgi:hypothetical protein